MICQSCGIEAPTKYAEFYQNIGMLLMRTHKSIKGNLCKKCIHKHFWQMTGTNVFLGWWGTISMIVTPFYILNNVGRYALCLGMQPPAADAQPPLLTDAIVDKLSPLTREMFNRLEHESFEQVAQNTALKAGVTPGQVCLYMQAVAQAAQKTS